MTDDTQKLLRLREMLPATGAGIYLATATRGPLPAETAAAMREADDWELRVGRVWDGRAEDVLQREEEARAVVAALIAADPDEVTLTRGLEDARGLARAVIDAGGVVIDATARVGAVAVDVKALGATAVYFAADRWLLGPESTGAMWTGDRGAAAPKASRELPRTALIGLARSIGWLEMYVGLEWIYERTARLATQLYDHLATTPGVKVLTPREQLGASLSFRIENWKADEAAEELSRRVNALVGQEPNLNAVVASVAWFNTEQELDRFAAAVSEIARFTPATIPRRPSLVVLTDS